MNSPEQAAQAWHDAATRKAGNYTRDMDRMQAFAFYLREQKYTPQQRLARERERYARGEITLEDFESYLDHWLAENP